VRRIENSDLFFATFRVKTRQFRQIFDKLNPTSRLKAAGSVCRLKDRLDFENRYLHGLGFMGASSCKGSDSTKSKTTGNHLTTQKRVSPEGEGF